MPLDYSKIGLKCGLEIHQQLDTKKLFCNCPSVLRQDEPDFSIKRKLHAVAGESGEVDIAAKYQTSLNKEFVYQGYDSTCLVETDEEPPHQLNNDALKIALQISEMLNAKIFPITQIMRKTVVDGSNTSGFQRTVLIARDGFVETKYGKVGIDSICLEEDSARKVESSFVSLNSFGKEENSAVKPSGKEDAEEGNKEVVYRLDRLGIPLIEIATSPDIKDPEQAREVALHIGKILRKCKVKRGIGTIRQDVNVSVKKGARVELKGVQKPELIEKSVEKEAERQLKFVGEKKKIVSEVRKVLPNGESEFLRPMPGAARMYPETDLPLLKISKDLINEVKKTLPEIGDDEEKYKKMGLNHEMIKILFAEDKIGEFTEFYKILNNPKIIFKIMLTYPKEIASHEKISDENIGEIFDYETLEFLLESFRDKKIGEEHLKHVMEKIAKGVSFEEAVKFEKHDFSAIEEKIHRIIKEKPGLSENAYMGLAMKEFKGKVSGKETMEIIKKYLN